MIGHPKKLGFSEKQIERFVRSVTPESANRLRPAIRAFGVKYDAWERDNGPTADIPYNMALEGLKAALQRECSAGDISVLRTLQQNYTGIEKGSRRHEKMLDAVKREATRLLKIGGISLAVAVIAYASPTVPAEAWQVKLCKSILLPVAGAATILTFAMGAGLFITNKVMRKACEINMMPAACEVSRMAREVVAEETGALSTFKRV